MDGLTAAYLIELAISIVLGLLGFFLKRSLKEIDRRAEKNESDIRGTAEELQQLEIRIARDYVTKDDHNATASQIDKKLTRIMDLIIELKER